MSNKRNKFVSFTTKDGSVRVGDNDITKSVGYGTVNIAPVVYE